MRYSGERLRALRAAVESCCLKIQGSYLGPVVQLRRDRRWSSIGEALRYYIVARVDGYGMPAMGDPEQIARKVHLGYQAHASARPPRAIEDADDLVVVAQALDHSLIAMTPAWPEDVKRLVVLARYAARLSPVQIAERLEERGFAVRASEIVQESSKAARGIAGRLEEAELIMPGEYHRAGNADLKGWQEIADYLRVSVRTARRWRAEHGMPVRTFTIGGVPGHVEAETKELDRWYVERLS